MRLRVLGSGSKGNCLAVRGGGRLLLIDCGFSCREVTKRLAACGVPIDAVDGILFTHDHADHCSALRTLCKCNPRLALYANGNTADAIASCCGVEDGWCVFETAVPFTVGGLTITSFSVPHDASDTVGYLIEDGTSSLFVGTDMGVVTPAAKAALARATCAVLESNHDPELLARSARPEPLKQRIRGRSGHLSNDQAADAIRELNPPNLRTLLLAHISRECNAGHLALETMERALGDLGRTDIALAALEQDVPSEFYEF